MVSDSVIDEVADTLYVPVAALIATLSEIEDDGDALSVLAELIGSATTVVLPRERGDHDTPLEIISSAHRVGGRIVSYERRGFYEERDEKVATHYLGGGWGDEPQRYLPTGED